MFGYGQTAGEAIVKHPDVPLVSFTGGTVTATKLRIAAAPFSKKLSLEVSICQLFTSVHTIHIKCARSLVLYGAMVKKNRYHTHLYVDED